MKGSYLKTIFLSCLYLTALSQPGILKQGKWLKIAVSQDGVYQIDYNLFSKIADPLSINPTQIKLFGFPTGMLPQANNSARAKGLREITIKLLGMDDGKFNSKDRIIFFGQGPDKISYIKEKNVFKIENNIYDDFNYYFLTVSETPGRRILPATTPTASAIELNTYTDYFYSETDRSNILKSGRDWFGIDFDANTEASISFEMDEIIDESPAKLITRLMAESYQNASFRIDFNGIKIGDFPISSIPQTSYGAKGRTRNDTTQFVFRGNAGKQSLKFTYDRGGNNYSIGRLDYLIAILKRKLSFSGTPKIFFNTEARLQPNEMVIQSDALASVWEISDPFRIEEYPTRFQNNSIRFITTGEIIRRFIIFSEAGSFLKPESAVIITNQNLSSIPAARMIIVSHPEFLTEAKRLSQHRLRQDGITSIVVSTDQIYHEYSGGKLDPTAIRDFVRDFYLRTNGELQYLLLFGKGTFDYRNLTTKKSTWVPIYQSYNSLSPLETYSSDDFYAFLEENEGVWNESPPAFHTLDIGVGRIPCTSDEQARDMVNKIISYDSDPNTKGSWRKQITFVADDGDGNIHQSQANQLAGWIEQKRPDLLAKRLFLDLYTQEEKSFGQVSPEAANELYRQFHEGSTIINFTGHGSEQLWMAERILDPEQIGKLNNRYRLPFLVTATCEFGRTDDPGLQSAAEQILLKKASGAIGLVTSARPVSSATNFDLNSDLYQALFGSSDQETPRLGTFFMRTKNARDTRIGNRNFILLGDPSMRLALPEIKLKITEISSGTDNRIGGLEKIRISGEAQTNETLFADLNGEATLELFDRPTSIITRGDENEPFGFEEWQQVLFRGVTEIRNGKFTFEFTTPPTTQTAVSAGKIQIHGSSNGLSADAGGAELPITFSPINELLTDSKPPTLKLWMNDTTFMNGGQTGKDPILIMNVTDESGIDLSKNPSRRLTIKLDNGLSTYGEPYYFATNGKANAGKLSYQFFDLEEGLHRLIVTVWDIGGNSTTSEIEFTVDASNWEITLVNGFPNPFFSNTSIFMEHTRPGEDLNGTIIITDRTGKQIRKIDFEQFSAPGKAIIAEWDGTDAEGNKLPSGLYFIRLDLRSSLYGLKRTAAGKVVLVN